MRVVRRRRAVGRPAGVGDPGEAAQGGLPDLRVELGDPRDASCAFRTHRVINCHAARVVAAILEALQSFDEDRNDVARADGTDDSAHGTSFEIWVDTAFDVRETNDVGVK